MFAIQRSWQQASQNVCSDLIMIQSLSPAEGELDQSCRSERQRPGKIRDAKIRDGERKIDLIKVIDIDKRETAFCK